MSDIFSILFKTNITFCAMNKEVVNNAKFIQLLLSIEYYRGNESYEIISILFFCFLFH